jgi:predicted transcriptional regulator YdeE
VLRRKNASALEPEIHERVEQLPELHLAGLSWRMSMKNPHQLPEMWTRLDALRASSGALDASTYSVILDVDRRAGTNGMMAALRVPANAALPPQLQGHRLPACTCTVFRHVIRKGDVFPQVQNARDVIHARYMSRPAQAHVPFVAFEVYPKGLAVTPGSWIDHYFPAREG